MIIIAGASSILSAIFARQSDLRQPSQLYGNALSTKPELLSLYSNKYDIFSVDQDWYTVYFGLRFGTFAFFRARKSWEYLRYTSLKTISSYRVSYRVLSLRKVENFITFSSVSNSLHSNNVCQDLLSLRHHFVLSSFTILRPHFILWRQKLSWF